jgi:hypothetical protein
MVEHSPVFLPTVSRLLESGLARISIELLVWSGILLLSEQNVPQLAVVFGGLKRSLNSVFRARFLALAGIFLVVLVGRLAALPVFPVPPPKIQDEFSQLLSADTFASGRLTNPTHPMWLYFETFFVNQNPTYHSMYPPATGLFMAAAQVLTGQPWFGMLFVFAASSAGVCWMLQGWMAPRWGLWGALVFILLAGRVHLAENYLGEGIFVLGGALIVGAVPRIVKRQSMSASVWLGIGVALLATSRPFEGASLATGTCLGGLYWASTTSVQARTIFNKVILPAALILIPVVAFVGYQNWRTTGSPWLAPYQLNLVQQHITRPLIWQKPADSPQYDHVAMASFYQQWETEWWKNTRGFPRGTFLFLAEKAFMTYATILWPLTFLVAVGSFQLLKSKTRRFLPLAFAFFLACLSLETYPLQPRYTEPAWGLAILLAVYGIRYIGVWRRRTRQGLSISRTAAMFIPAALVIINGIAFFAEWRSHTEHWYSARQQLSEALQFMPGKHLVLVRYSPSHIPLEEWVHNRADIDRAKVVWARDDANRAEADLQGYFADRAFWLLEPDGKFPTLTFLSGDHAEPAVSQSGSFRVYCGDKRCEDLKHRLEHALDGESKISIAESVK